MPWRSPHTPQRVVGSFLGVGGPDETSSFHVIGPRGDRPNHRQLITESHSTPHAPTGAVECPDSESLKYRPALPARFRSIQDARAHCHNFFPWYNVEHHHSGLGLLAPHDVHYGLAEHRMAARATVLAAAYAAHPERFSGGLPQPPARPTEAWINAPATRTTDIAPGRWPGPALC